MTGFSRLPGQSQPSCLGAEGSVEKSIGSPDWVAQLVRVSSEYAKVAGSLPGQGTYKKESVNGMHKCMQQQRSMSLSLNLNK